MGRRDYGAGSIQQRGKNRWLIRWSEGVDPITGQHIRRSKTVHGTKTEANRALAQRTAARSETTRVPLAELIRRWREIAGHADSTAANYDRALKWLPQPLADMPVDDIRVDTLDTTWARLVADGASRHTIVTLAAVVSGALEQAVTWQWLTVNVARSARVPKPDERDQDAIAVDHVRALITAADGDPLTAVWIRLMAVTGARRSEVLALRWRDIDLDASAIHIRATLDPYHATTKAPKTSGSRRTLAIDTATIERLREWLVLAAQRAAAVGMQLTDDSFIISDAVDSSTPWRPDLATKRFAQLRQRAGIPSSVRLHDLRHASATHLLAAGLDAKTVATRHGHSRVGTTTDLYASALPALDHHAADSIARLLDG